MAVRRVWLKVLWWVTDSVLIPAHPTAAQDEIGGIRQTPEVWLKGVISHTGQIKPDVKWQVRGLTAQKWPKCILPIPDVDWDDWVNFAD